MDRVFIAISICDKIKKSKFNIFVNALQRRHTLFTKFGAQIIGFDHVSKLYAQDSKFSFIFASCQQKAIFHF